MNASYYNRYIDKLLNNDLLYDFKDKQRVVNDHVSYMLSRTQSMFKYDNLPDTIPQRILELYLQVNGNCAFYEYNGNLYVFTGGLGGEPDVYYMPTIYTVANPALKLSKELKIDIDCVVIPSDSMYFGLLPLFRRYATALAENELSLKIAIINSRIVDLISAPDDSTKASAEKFLSDIEDGNMGVIGENAFLDGIKAQPYGTTGNSNIITNLIEYQQYVKASMFNEIGLNANYNMKRESLNSTEAQLNDDALLPLLDDMLRCREIGVDKVNKMFGTNIKVSLASAWEDNEIELKAKQEILEHDTEDPEEPEEPEEGGDDDKKNDD